MMTAAVAMTARPAARGAMSRSGRPDSAAPALRHDGRTGLGPSLRSAGVDDLRRGQSDFAPAHGESDLVAHKLPARIVGFSVPAVEIDRPKMRKTRWRLDASDAHWRESPSRESPSRRLDHGRIFEHCLRPHHDYRMRLGRRICRARRLLSLATENRMALGRELRTQATREGAESAACKMAISPITSMSSVAAPE